MNYLVCFLILEIHLTSVDLDTFSMDVFIMPKSLAHGLESRVVDETPKRSFRYQNILLATLSREKMGAPKGPGY